jgi:hypothetical protein
MRLTLLCRLLTWALAGLVLAGAAVALAVIWTANERLWYLDAGGIDATLDMTLTSNGRLVLTAILVGLMLLALATLAVERIARRRVAGSPERGVTAPVTGKTFTYVPKDSSSAALPVSGRDDRARGRYESTIVGTATSRRAEGTLPPGDGRHAEEAETLPPTARRIRAAGIPPTQTLSFRRLANRNE